MGKKTALIAGATGLVGGKLLELLLQDPYYEEVIVLTRKPMEGKSAKLKSLTVDFERLEEYAPRMTADDIFCCLGSTMKKAGSKEKFRKVDYDYPLLIAHLAKRNNAKQYLLISALGADKGSSIFYNRVKGEAEEAIDTVGYSSYHIFRPALLMGQREESRPGESAAQVFFKIFGFLFIGPLKKYKAIDAIKVARAMHTIAKENRPGRHIHESKALQNY
ncbi:Oxidoreductase [Fulvivirga imtechensis AK7]|uniref:Oxidoreductase n=1 Tax=Fulvivirga imtechensis AK7 TaxID=1237149 RepID=L8JVN7_9BACT|nr:oxidoreductase [Fulvivirga imtechensis]ELR73121.1 Oxidoreductase [Fulvivirga imtechensis AK7]